MSDEPTPETEPEAPASAPVPTTVIHFRNGWYNHTPIDVATMTEFWRAALADDIALLDIPVSGPDPSVLEITVGPKDILMIVSVIIPEPEAMTPEQAAALPWGPPEGQQQQRSKGNRAKRRGRN